MCLWKIVLIYIIFGFFVTACCMHRADQNIVHEHPWLFLSFCFFEPDSSGNSLFTTISLTEASFLPGGVCVIFYLKFTGGFPGGGIPFLFSVFVYDEPVSRFSIRFWTLFSSGCLFYPFCEPVLLFSSFYTGGDISGYSGPSLSSFSPMTSRPGISLFTCNGGRFWPIIVPLASSSPSSAILVRILSLFNLPVLSKGPAGYSSSSDSPSPALSFFIDFFSFFFRFLSFLSARRYFRSSFFFFFSSSLNPISIGPDGP